MRRATVLATGPGSDAERLSCESKLRHSVHSAEAQAFEHAPMHVCTPPGQQTSTRTRPVQLQVNELYARLNVLLERDEKFWSEGQMRRVLRAGGITPEPKATRAELLVLTSALADTENERWKEEGAAAWAKAIDDAIAKATAGTPDANAATKGKRKAVQFAKGRLARWAMGKPEPAPA